MAKRRDKNLLEPGKRQNEEKVHVDKLIHVIVLINGKLIDDRPFWVIVAVNPIKYQAF